MAQTLYVKLTDGSHKAVQVIRSWAVNGGSTIYLHADGRYAYKDGSPLRSPSELDILPAGHRDRAIAWWKRAGFAEAQAYYKALSERALRLAGDFQPDTEGGDRSELDAVAYTRKQAKKGAAVSAPHAWMEWFPKRPDWWGQARIIGFADFIYEMIDEKESGTPPAISAAAEG